MSLSRIAVRKPIATCMLYLGLSLIGIFGLFQLPVNLMPNAGAGSLTIFIGIRGGLPPEDIENLVTNIVEEAVSTTQYLTNMLSVCRKDRSVTTLFFEPGTDVSFAALEVSERLAKIRNKLPKDIEKPVVAHYSENDYPIIILALTSDTFTPEQLRELVDNGLKPMLKRVNGVANVEVGGGRERKILVEFDKGRLEAYQLSIRKVINQLGVNNLNLLTGKVEKRRDSYQVRTMGQYQTIEDMKKLTVSVTEQGSRIQLRDIAEVRDFYMEAQSHARLNRKPTVSVYVQKESLTNTIRVAKEVKEVIDQFREEALNPQIDLQVVTDQSIFINDAIANVKGNLRMGALITALILFIFLKDWKHTAIIFVSIPLSVFITFGLMYFSGLTLNVMTLSGLALGIGMLVDNSIVVLENIVEKKRLNILHKEGRHVFEVTIGAAEQMGMALIASTMTTIVVFLPIVFINKQVKILYSGLAYTVTFSLISSLFVATTVVPLLASRVPLPAYSGYLSPGLKEKLLRYYQVALPYLEKFQFLLFWRRGEKAVLPEEAAAAVGEDAPAPEKKGRLKRLFGFLKETKTLLVVKGKEIIHALRTKPRTLFVRISTFSIRRQPYLFTILSLLTLGTLVIYALFLEKEFLGTTEQNEFIIFVELPAGAKLDISDKVVAEVEKIVSEAPEISKVVKTAAARVEGWSSKVYVTLLPRSERARSVQDIIDELRPRVAEIGAVYDTFIYFSEPESSKEFVIDVFGHDYAKLRDLATEISQRLGKVAGLADIKLRYKPGRPEVKINVDKERASLFGFTVKDVADSLHAQVRGLRATYFYTANQQIETVARLQEKHRKSLEDLHFLTLVTPRGAIVPLKQLASFEFGLTPSEIWRKAKQRVIQVSANREKLALSTAAEKTRSVLRGMEVPTGYYYQIGGDYVAMVQNEKEFRFAFIIMVGLVFIVLASMFESYVQPFLIMATIPMALIGCIPLLYISNTPVTMGVYIGMIMLGGIVVNSAIILVDQLNLSHQGGESLTRSVLVVSWMRARPILMTALTTTLGLFPMVWTKSESSQLWAPLALTVIGGMVVATMLTLFIIPALYYYLEFYKGRLMRRLGMGD